MDNVYKRKGKEDCALSYLDEPDKVEWYEENNAEYVELEDLEKDGMQISVEDESVGTQIMSCVKSKEQRAGYFKTAYKKANATAYAKQYAVNPNEEKYGMAKRKTTGKPADCTNFASQILEAGGKRQNTKWYCTYIPIVGFKYSSNWAAANNFSNYWGIDYKFYTHSVFSQNLKTGDFITYDKTGDGSWDHIGYVTGVRKSYSKKLGYRNYRVAQHTKNYNAWTSTKENGWDELQSQYPSIRFGIIRF